MRELNVTEVTVDLASKTVKVVGDISCYELKNASAATTYTLVS